VTDLSALEFAVIMLSLASSDPAAYLLAGTRRLLGPSGGSLSGGGVFRSMVVFGGPVGFSVNVSVAGFEGSLIASGVPRQLREGLITDTDRRHW